MYTTYNNYKYEDYRRIGLLCRSVKTQQTNNPTNKYCYLKLWFIFSRVDLKNELTEQNPFCDLQYIDIF